jgi:hypothetical protein
MRSTFFDILSGFISRCELIAIGKDREFPSRTKQPSTNGRARPSIFFQFHKRFLRFHLEAGTHTAL